MMFLRRSTRIASVELDELVCLLFQVAIGLGLQLAKKGQGCLCVLPVQSAKPGYFAFAFKSHRFAFCQSFGSLYSCFGSAQLCVQHLFATLVCIRGFSGLYLEQTHYDCHSLEGQFFGTVVEGEMHSQLSALWKFAATIEVRRDSETCE